jgi:hypothetical protein
MKKFLSGLFAAGLLIGALGTSQALTQFAVLNPVPSPPGDPLQTPYHWDNATTSLSVIDQYPLMAGTNLDVRFAFLQPVPVIGTNTIDAILTISAVADGTMVGTSQPLKSLTFTVIPKNVGDVFGAGILLETTIPNPLFFPDGTLGELFSVGNSGFLQTDFGRGLVMSSSYILIDPDEDQLGNWSFSLIDPAGPFAMGPGMFLRDTKLGGNANFSATVFNIVPEPGSVAMLIGFGVGGSLALLRRRRSR